MTSMFDQYEQASQHTPQTLPEQEMFKEFEDISEEDVPIISIQKFKNAPTFTSKLSNICVSNDTMVVSQTNGLLISMNINTPNKPKEVDISKTGAKLRRMFIDPIIGCHMLLSLGYQSPVNSEFHYLHIPTMKLKQVSRINGHDVTAVAWNFNSTSHQKTGPILFGTSKGLIYEAELEAESDKLFQSGVELYCKQIFDIGKGDLLGRITGLEFHCFFSSIDKYFILATTATKLYQFAGTISNREERPLLSQIFNNYLNTPEGFIEMPNENQHSRLQFYYGSNIDNSSNIYPKVFGWHIDGIGIVYGKIDTSYQSSPGKICMDNIVIDYTPLQPAPTTFILTEFHALLLYPKNVTAISILNKQTVSTEFVDDAYGRFVGITRDIKKDNIWLCSDCAVFKCTLIKEDKFVWKIYMDMGKFELASQYCSDNIYQLNQVLQKQADQCFQEKRYEEAAELYSNTECVFEEIALKFIQVGNIDALKFFLIKKLENLKSQQSTQITMLTLWLIELYETQLSDIRNNKATDCDEYRKLQDSFERFLSIPQVANCIKANREIVYKLLNNHGDAENYIKIAAANKDYEKVIRHFIITEDVQRALSMFGLNSVPKDLIYEFTSEIMPLAPKQMVDVLIRQGNKLDQSMILQALIFPYDDDNQAIEVIRYLEYCVHSAESRNEEIHNYLITLYAKYKPDRVMSYLALQGQEISLVNYDVRYALRLCQEYNLTEACVQLSSLLGLWESAVELALTVSIDLAKKTISLLHHDNLELCKKLWLKIAKHVVNECNDIKQAMSFLEQCDLIKIEDVLQFFPDFTTIDHFKDAICSSLQEYNQNIEALKEEMEDATRSADSIRNEIQAFKNRYVVIQATDECNSCSAALMSAPFYRFPCNHQFHADCLVSELKPFLSKIIFDKLQGLQHQLALMSSTTDTTSVNSRSLSFKEQVKQEIDSIIASECFFCGDIAIEQIDQAFINEDEFERIKQDWE